MIETAAIISTERLDLIPATPAFLAASLRGDQAAAEGLLGLAVPPDWFRKTWLLDLRLRQLREDPSLLPWLLRAIGLRDSQMVVGHIGFHSQPDPEYLHDLAPGGVEIGYSVYAPFRRRGYAREACAALMRWAHEEQGVTRFVVSISPDNAPSLHMAESFGFRRVGSHIDEIDGLEDIYVVDVGGTARTSGVTGATSGTAWGAGRVEDRDE
jgi:RimJ/RimL family protein N-acetyltransferase